MNSINISGNLIKGAEIKYIGKNNTPCVEFVIARSNKFKNDRGNLEEHTMFFEVVLFGSFGEKILKFLGKGKKVYIQGELKQDRWEYEDKKYSRIFIIAHRVFLEGRDSTNTSAESQTLTEQTNGAIQNAEKEPDTPDMSAIPF